MDILNSYKKHLKLPEVEELLDLIIYRPLAYIFVKMIFSTNITPNHITINAMIIGATGGLLLTFNTSFANAVAGILLISYNVLDCADGQLARIKMNGSTMGRILDGVADYIVSIFIYLGIGIGFAMNSDNPSLYWLLTLGAALSNAIHSAILDYYRNKYLDIALERESTLGKNLESFRKKYKELYHRQGHRLEKTILWFYIKYSNLQLKIGSSGISSSDQYYGKEYIIRRHKPLMHLWTYIGPTTELTFLIVCAFLGRLDIFLWGMVTVANGYVLILLLLQKTR